MIVGIEVHFDAAHYLPDYIGKCSKLHGHTWTVEVEVSGEVKADGMVVDLTQLKKDVNTLIEVFDHQLLNAYLYRPTCENIVIWIHRNLTEKYSVNSVKVKEGQGGWARI
jgi:6-pyruvoyltetrahydropterin/6-carboxytetrahydropterin synthase